MASHLLYLMRHGRAEAGSPTGHDADRELTDDGRRQAADQGAALGRLRDPGAITLCSPLIRCVQTAEIVAATAGSAPPRPHEDLREESRRDDLHALVDGLPSGALLVGHQPSLIRLAATLLGSQGEPFDFRTGTVVGLERRTPGWALVLVLQPDTAGKLAFPGA